MRSPSRAVIRREGCGILAGEMPIARLPIHLVNKISAGEVVERPASVVKELVENALDAGATRIDVTIDDGGKRRIRVADNGGGMSRADAALTFAPHATSKIAVEDDLFRIETMGFRGEALASIASISHARLQTRRAEEDSGWDVSAAGGHIDAPAPCAAPVGTSVTVCELFFNTPARRKFLRTTNTEFGHITEQLVRLALPRPDVAFTLRHNGRETLNLPACESTRSRAEDLFTAELAGHLLPIVSRTGEVRVEGLLGPPVTARASAKWQYVFLNGRYIRDRLLGHALREAFRGLLAPNRWPVAFLFLELAPRDVDVNVHPTKIEVRFRDGNRVYGEVLTALRETLQRSDLRPDVQRGGQERDAVAEKQDTARRDSLREAMADFLKSQSPRIRQPALHLAPPSPTRDVAGGWAKRESLQRAVAEPPAPVAPVAPPRRAVPVVQIHNAYIVAQSDDGLMIVDQHALHERILYNEFKARLAKGKLTGQKMLIPQPVTVTPAEAALLEESKPLLATLGMEVAPFGPNVYAVQQYPTILAERGVAIDAFVRELLDRLAEEKTTDTEHVLEELLAMLACKAAVKAGTPLGAEEMLDLLNGLDVAEKASACPHGRPTTLRLTLRDLEKQFHRT